MTAAEIVLVLGHHGVELRANGDRVRLVIPPGSTLPPTMIEVARAAKGELLAMLSSPPNPLTLDTGDPIVRGVTRASAVDVDQSARVLDFKPGTSVAPRDLKYDWLPQDWIDNFEERASLLEDDAGVSGSGLSGGSPDTDMLKALTRCLETNAAQPIERAGQLATLLLAEEHLDFYGKRWMAAKAGALRFALRWAPEARRIGWTYDELFGLDSVAPYAAIDRSGLAWMLGDGEVVAIDEETATIKTFRGAHQTYYR